MNLDELFAQADSIIDKGMEKSAQQKPVSGDEILKLAQQLRTPERPPAIVEGINTGFTLTEKLAEAVAITNTLLNLDRLAKIAEFEEKAAEQGFEPDLVEAFIEKNAGQMRNILTEIPLFSEGLAEGNG